MKSINFTKKKNKDGQIREKVKKYWTGKKIMINTVMRSNNNMIKINPRETIKRRKKMNL